MSVRGCYQGVIGRKAAENRLREINVRRLQFPTQGVRHPEGKVHIILADLLTKGQEGQTQLAHPQPAKVCP